MIVPPRLVAVTLHFDDGRIVDIPVDRIHSVEVSNFKNPHGMFDCFLTIVLEWRKALITAPYEHIQEDKPQLGDGMSADT